MECKSLSVSFTSSIEILSNLVKEMVDREEKRITMAPRITLKFLNCTSFSWSLNSSLIELLRVVV